MSITENQTENLSFGSLIANVENIHSLTNAYAKGAVNQLLTIRNWMIGYYIVEFVPYILYKVPSNLCGGVAQIKRDWSDAIHTR